VLGQVVAAGVHPRDDPVGAHEHRLARGVTHFQAAGIPAGRLGTSDDVAAVALYLASAEAAYMTGQTLHVNGGMAMI